MKKLLIIQHCQSEHHINDLSGGWTDTPLTDYGQRQAYAIAQRLEGEINPQEFVLYSSDLLRAKGTADIIGRHLNLKVKENHDLREINTGIAAGKTKEWVRNNESPRKKPSYDIDHLSFPMAETDRQFYQRVCKCIEDIYSTEDSNLIIVTHGGTLSKIVAWWLKFTPEMMNDACFLGSAGGLTILTKSRYEQNALTLFNDTSHFQGLT